MRLESILAEMLVEGIHTTKNNPEGAPGKHYLTQRKRIQNAYKICQ